MARGELVVDSLDKAAIVIRRLARRGNPQTLVATPAVPIYQFTNGIPSDGVLLRYLFPLIGRLTKLVLHVPGVKKENPLSIQAELVRDKSSQTMQGILVKEMLILEPEFEIQELDRLLVTTPATIETHPSIISFEVATIFRPILSSAELTSVAYPEIEESENEGV